MVSNGIKKDFVLDKSGPKRLIKKREGHIRFQMPIQQLLDKVVIIRSKIEKSRFSLPNWSIALKLVFPSEIMDSLTELRK